MAYDYLGTMGRDQFDDLVAFARKQMTLVGWQDAHARAEIKRLDSFLAKMTKAHDVFFGGTLGVGRFIPRFREREIFPPEDPDTDTGGASLEIGAPVNEPRLAHVGREETMRPDDLPLKVPPFDLRDALHDSDTAEVSRAIKAPILPAIKHQRDGLEWRVRKIQDRQEQLEEARLRRQGASVHSLEKFVSLIDRMFTKAFKEGDSNWWNLNPQPGVEDPTRPDVIFRLGRYSPAQKAMDGAIGKAVESNQKLQEEA